MISDERAEKAQQWMVDHARPAAIARAQHAHLDDMKKVMLARITQTAEGSSEAERTRNAMASKEYEEFLVGLRAAAEADHEYRNLQTAAERLLDAWQTHSANVRKVR